MNRHTPFKPLPLFRVPTEAMHGHGIEQFIGENAAPGARRLQGVPGVKPLNRRGQSGVSEGLLLALPAAGGRFHNSICDGAGEIGPMGLEPLQNVHRKASVVRAGFDDLPVIGGQRLEPSGELKREKLAEEAARADAGEVVPFLPRRCVNAFVVSKIWTIQGQLHEAHKRNCPLAGHFFNQDSAYIGHFRADRPSFGHESCSTIAGYMAKIDAFFNLMFEQKASDLHVSAGNPPMLRINGELHRVDYPPLDNDNLKLMLYEIAPEYKIKVFEETGDVDFGYEIPNVSRFRANFFNQKNGIGAVFRQIPSKVVAFEDFEKMDAALPPVLKKFAMLQKGLVLVTGPTGSGKSTTLAAIIDYCNKNRKDHIITVEDPIEFVHESKNCLVNHREVGIHTKSFASALRGALREDPDIILVGEMRDLETIELAI